MYNANTKPIELDREEMKELWTYYWMALKKNLHKKIPFEMNPWNNDYYSAFRYTPLGVVYRVIEEAHLEKDLRLSWFFNIFENKKPIRTYILEYLTKDSVSLYHYLKQPGKEKKKYLYEMYPYLFEKYADKYDLDLEIDYDNPEDVIDFLSRNPKLKKDFNEYLYKGIIDFNLPIDDSDYPAWSFFSDNPQIIKNQWLVHFTSDSLNIYKEGFKYGVEEIDKLGLTTRLADIDKRYGGFNFAYTPYDCSKYSRDRHGYKYGEEVVIFKASGVRVLHYSDQEYQTIFYGDTATNINSITQGENGWGVESNIDSSIILYENEDLDKVIDWFINNYDQYRKHLRNPYGRNV